MKISKIYIDNFRVFNDSTINLGDNLTCISGYNGVGKSTLLAILSNVGELKKGKGTHINGNPFKGDFSEIIKGDPKYDKSGEKCTVYFKDLPPTNNEDNPFVEQLKFRSFFQSVKRRKSEIQKITAIVAGKEEELNVIKKIELPNSYNRYRLIPIKSEERNTESKLSWPTYYLGLSRLYPIGESTVVNSKNNIPEEILDDLMKTHKSILSSNDIYENPQSIEISDAKKKKGFGILTSTYSDKMNSSGQDNLGQILLTIYSFELLKNQLKEEYNGGLFLIDEIDATLHPVAQNKLIDFLEHKSKELNIQIVFTTHSLSLLDHVISKKDKTRGNKDISIVYLTKKRGELETIEDPSMNFIRNDLMNTYSGAQSSKSVPILTEDEVGRWFIKKIITYNSSVKSLDLNFIEMNTGWTEIVKLIKNDYIYFKNYIIALDPDINQSDNYLKLKKSLEGTRFSLTRSHTNILLLPGDTFVEKMMWDFVSNLDPGHPFFYNENIEDAALNKQSLLEYGPFSQTYNKYSGDKNKIKAWFNQNTWMIDIIFDYWVVNNDNEKICAEFFNKLVGAYEPIYYQRR